VPDLAVGPGLTIPFAESRLPHFVCRPSLVPVVVCRPRLLPAAAPITWPRPDLPLGSALNSPPTATRGNHPPRPLHQPPPTILLAPLLLSQRRGPPRPPVECRRPSRAVPPAVAVCCRRLLSPSAPRPTPPTAAAVVVVVALAPRPIPHPRSCSSPSPSSSTPTSSQSLSPPPDPSASAVLAPPKPHRLSRRRPLPLATRRRPRHMLSPSPPLSSPQTQLFSVAVRRDDDPPSCRVQTTPRIAAPGATAAVPRPCRATTDPPPRHSLASHPSSLFGPRQTTPVAPPLTRRSPPPLRSPDVLHRSRRSPPRPSSLPPRSSPARRQFPSPEPVQTTSPSTPPVSPCLAAPLPRLHPCAPPGFPPLSTIW
jgi:hypothetical protein